MEIITAMLALIVPVYFLVIKPLLSGASMGGE